MDQPRPDLGAALAREVRGEVRFDVTSRALWSADASNYRHVPIGVVQPMDEDDVLATLEVCRRHEAAVLARGAGTSIGGQAVNEAVVLDFSRHLNRVLEVDPGRRTARVQPGVVLDRLQAAVAGHGLRFGPDPSTHSRCTVGGMIGNNACGSHSVAWGKTVDNVRSLDVVTAGGTRLEVGPTSEAELAQRVAAGGEVGRLYRELVAVRERYGAAVAAGFPRLTRRVSGYNLDQLSEGFDLARALVGSEGTCAVVLGATVDLVEAPPARALTVLGFRDAFAAADNVMPLLELGPLAMEGIDAGLVAALRAARPDEQVTRLLPPGAGWLYVESGGASPGEAAEAAGRVAELGERLGASSLVVRQAEPMRALWRIREDGAGIVTRLPGGGEAWPGWEDSAVPPERLGDYLRGLSALMEGHGLGGAFYGHFGDGCVHLRVDFDLLTAPGVARFRSFMEDAADLVAAHGGSLSGEHGDGQARAELLPRMYPPAVIEAFAAFKAAWDPGDRLNPGNIVAPRRLDDDLRVFLGVPTIDSRTALAFQHDGGSFATATRRCVGVGKCLAPEGGVMCPSYRATGEETHSTRGRARLLFEMASGQLVEQGWRSTQVRDALDLCLSCKGCKSDCPVGVDMASYKSEFLSHHYARRVRPASHYSMGWLPLWLRLASRASRLANAVMAFAPTAWLLKRLGGIAPERALPAVAPQSLVRWFRRRPTSPPQAGGVEDRPAVLLWPDTFSNYFDPHVGRAAVAVLERAGYRVELPAGQVCCGLTWLSTGQVGIAQRVLRHTVEVLRPYVERGLPIVGLEPSCTALLKSDLADLLPADPAAAQVSSAVRTFAEVLSTAPALPALPATGEGTAGARASVRALAQVHCHQHAELGFDADRQALARLGIDVEVLDSGCCGLAGNFGFEAGHYDVSMACAERVLLPAVRAADSDVEVLADGFSCRTQIRQASPRGPVHLAELAARAWGLDV